MTTMRGRLAGHLTWSPSSEGVPKKSKKKYYQDSDSDERPKKSKKYKYEDSDDPDDVGYFGVVNLLGPRLESQPGDQFWNDPSGRKISGA